MGDDLERFLALPTSSTELVVASTVQAAFDQFFGAINLSGDNREIANKRRDRIKEILEKSLTVLDCFATGSIPRYTALRDNADLDVIVALHYAKHIEGRKPSQVLQSVRDVLAEYRTSLRRNGQAVTLYYNSWPNVDVVPVSRVVKDDKTVNYYMIPDMNSETWLPSRPRKHSNDLEERSSTCGPNLRKVIKMVKHWNTRMGARLQSYHLEVMALRTFRTGMTDITWDVFSYFDSAANLVSGSLIHEAGIVDEYLDWDTRSKVVADLSAARDTARQAWYYTYGGNANHEAAIREWRKIFGQRFPPYS